MLRYSDFILENSKNDPIPEIRDKKIAIILLGIPGIGKTTFYKNFILPKNNIKSFSTDDISVLYTNDPNNHKKGSSSLNIKRLSNFIKTNQSFVYDTTGNKRENILKVCNESKTSGYKIIFIHILGDLETALNQNSSRDRNINSDFIKKSYDDQFLNMKEYSEICDKYYTVRVDGDRYKINSL